MTNNLTEIIFVLDKSGSMSATSQSTINGFNDFLDDQRETAGACRITLIQFGMGSQVSYEAQPLAAVGDLAAGTSYSFEPADNDPTRVVYTPNDAGTQLYDALCQAIDNTGARFAAMNEADRPGKVIMVIITDGLENASRRHTVANVKTRIQHQTEAYQWQFIFLGANQDAVLSAQELGIRAGTAMTYAQNDAGITSSYMSLGHTVSAIRSCVVSSDMAAVGFTEEQREEQAKAKVTT
jgi:hypothetical protein